MKPRDEEERLVKGNLSLSRVEGEGNRRKGEERIGRGEKLKGKKERATKKEWRKRERSVT